MKPNGTFRPEFPHLYPAVIEADARIRPVIRETPLEFSASLSRNAGCRVWLKLENWQITGSFKLRGAANRLLSLGKAGKKRTLVTASSGNHGAAVAFMLRHLGLKGLIYLPETADAGKINILRRGGAEVRLHGSDCAETEIHAREQAAEKGYVYVPPYNDEYIIAGQGTIGMELERQIENLDAVLVPVGGGGLISGIASYLKKARPGVQIIGCQPMASAVMAKSVQAGRIITEAPVPTLSDGTAGGIEAGSLTFDLCRSLVDDFILVDEKTILKGLITILTDHHMLIEGSAALPVAALLQSGKRFQSQTIALVLTGRNIGMDRLKSILHTADDA